MAFTLADVAAIRSLSLDVRSGGAALDRPVGWVHVSELVDPTPFVEGGELLMTVGLWLTDHVDVGAYVRRLVGVGVVGLGFGVGPAHDDVPPALREAAAREGLPLLVVPRETPFIAISKAVSQALAAEQYEEITRGFRQQQRLTAAAVGDEGAAGVVRLLAEEVGGWVLLLDTAGSPRAASPAEAGNRAAALAPEVERLGPVTAPASVALAGAGEHVLLLPLLASRRVRGFLAVGTAARPTPGQRSLVNGAAALLALVLEQATALRPAEQRLRTAVLRLLLVPAVASGPSARELWPDLPEDPVVVVVATGTSSACGTLAAVLDGPQRGDDRVLTAVDDDGRLVAVVAAGGPAHRRIAATVGTTGGLRVGESDPAPLTELPRAHREAVQALEAGKRLHRPFTRHADVGGSGLLQLVGPDAGQAFAESLLGPLLAHDEAGRGTLAASLRTWLDHNGHWDPAAAALGVHRHTLRHRITRVGQLLDRDLGAAGVRAELWTALQLLDGPSAP